MLIDKDEKVCKLMDEWLKYYRWAEREVDQATWCAKEGMTDTWFIHARNADDYRTAQAAVLNELGNAVWEWEKRTPMMTFEFTGGFHWYSLTDGAETEKRKLMSEDAAHEMNKKAKDATDGNWWWSRERDAPTAIELVDVLMDAAVGSVEDAGWRYCDGGLDDDRLMWDHCEMTVVCPECKKAREASEWEFGRPVCDSCAESDIREGTA